MPRALPDSLTLPLLSEVHVYIPQSDDDDGFSLVVLYMYMYIHKCSFHERSLPPSLPVYPAREVCCVEWVETDTVRAM